MSGPASTSVLDALRAHDIIDDGARDALAARPYTPWWLAILLALAAWIASLFILASFFGPLLALGDSEAVRAIGGAGLIALALFLFRRGAAFTDQMALAFSLAGQALVGSAVTEGFFDGPGHSADVVAAVMLAVSAAMAVPPSSQLHRTVCGLIALASLAYLVGPGSGLAVLGVVLAATSVALWLSRVRWAAQRHAPLIKAMAHATTLSALVLAPYGNARSGVELLLSLVATARPTLVPVLYAGGTAAVLLAATAWLTRGAAPSVRAAALAAALVFALAAHDAPGLVVCAAILIAVFHACHRAWIALTLVFALLYVGEFYYSLHDTLLAKSLALMATGAVLLALRFGMRFATRRIG